MPAPEDPGSIQAGQPVALAGLGRRLASLLYEALLATAVVFIAAYAFSALTQFRGSGPLRPVFQAWIAAVVAGYFTYFWSAGRRTLAMKTWRLRVVTRDGRPLSAGHALLRFLLAGSLLAGVGLLWALFDRERLFLHDRLAGTRLELTPGPG